LKNENRRITDLLTFFEMKTENENDEMTKIVKKDVLSKISAVSGSIVDSLNFRICRQS